MTIRTKARRVAPTLSARATTRPAMRAAMRGSLKRDPARAAAPLRIVRNATQAGAGSEATVYLYDEIGFWGVTAAEFVQQLAALDVDTIHLRLNSPGGDVFDGITMYNALLQHPAQIMVHVDGLAASIASVIALAGDEVIMAENAFLMIHQAWTIALGNADELRTTAGLLDKIDAMITATYVKQSSAPRDQVVAWMADETWFDAQEAVDAGFATEIAGTDEAADDDGDEEEAVAAALRAFDLSVFAHTPEPLTRLAAAVKPAAAAAPKTAPTIRDLERTLRDAGLSRSEAKAFAALGSKALGPQRDAGADTVCDPDDSTVELHVGLQQLIANLRS